MGYEQSLINDFFLLRKENEELKFEVKRLNKLSNDALSELEENDNYLDELADIRDILLDLVIPEKK